MCLIVDSIQKHKKYAPKSQKHTISQKLGM